MTPSPQTNGVAGAEMRNIVIYILGECITLWGERERGSVVSTSPPVGGSAACVAVPCITSMVIRYVQAPACA